VRRVDEETQMKLVARVEKSLPPPVWDAYRAMVKALWEHGKLDHQLREMLRVRSAVLADCHQ
jgi:hypothetical protein